MKLIPISKKGKNKKVRKKLTDLDKEQRLQIKEISTLLKNIGFHRISGIDGKNVNFDGRTTEMDDIFHFENIILITEYTVGSPGDHLLKKKIFYDKILENKREFIDFLIKEPKLNSFNEYYTNKIKDYYTVNQLQLRILYCSKQIVSQEHKEVVPNIIFFDYHIVKYFQSLTKIIKKSSKYEFLDFIKVPFNKFAENTISSSLTSSEKFSGYILPEEKSSFKEGYKIISFYMDADSLLKRAYVLRQNGWKDADNVGHYQRMLASRKINSMRKYLSEENRVFINNIITSIASNKIKLFDENGKEIVVLENGQFKDTDLSDVIPARIEISNESNIIGIIDGQHRTYAYHEGDDIYEKNISKSRKIQNLLVTGILFPSNENERKRLKFETSIFMEINSNQSNASSQLKQEIEMMMNPFSSTAIAKKVLAGLNKNGPFANMFEQYWYEKGKIKTSSIVNYGLRPLIKIDKNKSKDSIFSLWKNLDKNLLTVKENEEFELLEKYIIFCIEEIRNLMIAFKTNISSDKWKLPSRSNPSGILTVTFVNSIFNTMRILIENNKTSSISEYSSKLGGIDAFDLKKYKSSQYRTMGEDIYAKFFDS